VLDTGMTGCIGPHQEEPIPVPERLAQLR
jgi:hypothetical protein